MSINGDSDIFHNILYLISVTTQSLSPLLVFCHMSDVFLIIPE